MSVFNKCRKDFFCEVIILLFSIKVRVNFLQLSRFGNFKEQRCRQQIEIPFPWLDFNKGFTLLHGGSRFVNVTYASSKGNIIRKFCFGADNQVNAFEIQNCYQSKFQVEFLFRDAKQSTELNNSQARSENKLNFLFDVVFTAINIAKVEHWLGQPKKVRKPFLMTYIRTVNHKRLLLQRFIDVFDVNAYSAKNRNHVNDLVYYGTIAA